MVMPVDVVLSRLSAQYWPFDTICAVASAGISTGPSRKKPLNGRFIRVACHTDGARIAGLRACGRCILDGCLREREAGVPREITGDGSPDVGALGEAIGTGNGGRIGLPLQLAAGERPLDGVDAEGHSADEDGGCQSEDHGDSAAAVLHQILQRTH
jgi:hypothetical protein